MTIEELAADSAIDTVMVAFTDHYGRLVGKRFDAGFFVETVREGTHACDYLLTVDMEMEPIPGFEFASWDEGYGDVHLVPDLTTLRRAAWTDGAAIVLCDVVDQSTHELVPIAPRTVLRRQVDRLAEHGLAAKVASELEFYLYDDTYREAHDKGYRDLRSAGWYVDDYHLLQASRVEPYVGAARRALNDADIPVENSKGECGRGQHELNIRFADTLTMADRHTVMKHGMKELADAMGLSVSFMAKPSTEDTGSSSHLHLSLWEHDVNVCGADDTRSVLFEHFLAGWMTYVDDVMVCYAPTVNSYKRYVDGSWAPTRVAWSSDNRTASFRVVGTGQSRRVECRLPGADCNPYLAYAGALAAGIAGIEQQLPLPDEFRGDVYAAADLPRVPRTLGHATDSFDGSAMARAAFGDDVVDHYTHFFRSEVEAYHATVTDWERRRYFERI